MATAGNVAEVRFIALLFYGKMFRQRNGYAPITVEVKM